MYDTQFSTLTNLWNKDPQSIQASHITRYQFSTKLRQPEIGYSTYLTRKSFGHHIPNLRQRKANSLHFRTIIFPRQSVFKNRAGMDRQTNVWLLRTPI